MCEVPGWGYQLTPDRVLAEMQDVGLAATEFGPDGFLPADPARMADELGDMLFVMANLARKLDLDPESCLRQANLKFSNRFNKMEQSAASAGKALSEMSLEDMEDSWQRVKLTERLTS